MAGTKNKENYKQELITYYDNIADKMQTREGLLPRFKVSLVINHVDWKAKVLDAGCGNGIYTIPIAKKVKKVTAIDFSEGMLKKLKQRAKEEKVKNISINNADITKLPYKNNSFDAAISYSTLYNIKEFEGAIRELNRVLIDGGALIFDICNLNSLGALYYKRAYHMPQFYRNMNEVEGILARNGFAIVEKHRFELIPRFNFLVKLLNIEIFGKSIDETISNLPLLRNFSFRYFFVCKKVI